MRVYIAHMFYYIFWLKSSRGTNELVVRAYPGKPDKEKLEEDLEDWCKGFAAWVVSENVCNYGWKRLKSVPKNRREAIKKFNAAYKAYEIANLRKRVLSGLLNCAPFNGQKVKIYKCVTCKDTGSVQLPPAFPRLSGSHIDCPKCFPPRKRAKR